MRRVIHKLYFIWSYDKEEKWLNEMAAKGFVLVSVGFARYEFEDCAPGEYNIRLELLKETVNHPESQNYIHFLEETGAEHIGTLFRWVYFRKKADTAPFNLFSDIDSRIRHLNRMIVIPGIFCIMNMINAINMTLRCIIDDINTALLPAILTWAVSLIMGYGFTCLLSKKQKLKKERLLYE